SMRLRSEIGILAPAMERIFAYGRGQQTALAIHYGSTHAERPEIKADDSSHSLLAALRGMPIHLPTEVVGSGFVHRSRHLGHVGSDMVLESLAANVLQQILQVRNLGHARAAKGLQRIISESSFTDVSAQLAVGIVCRNTQETHRT